MMMPLDLSLQAERLTTAENVFEFFLVLFEACADLSEVEELRQQLAEPSGAWLDELARDLNVSALTDYVSGAGEFGWDLDFQRTRKGALRLLQIALERADSQMAGVVCAHFLQVLDPLVGSIMRQRRLLTYPTQPRYKGLTLVYRGRRFFPNYRESIAQKAPPELEHGTFDQVMHLQSCYVVEPERRNDYIEWRVIRMPAHVESTFAEQACPRIFLLAWPHDDNKFAVDIDDTTHTFRVRPVYDVSMAMAAARALQGELESGPGYALAILPELVAGDALRQQIQASIAAVPFRVGLVLPGSEHTQADGKWRNRVVAIDPLGRDLADVFHDKISQFELTDHSRPAHTRKVLEGISTSPRRVTFLHSDVLGRIAIVICRDMLEPPFAALCLRHRPDHIFVLAMNHDGMAAFHEKCSNLGKLIDAAIYVVNAGGCPRTHPSYVYLPFSGRHRYEPESIDTPHATCGRRIAFGAHGFTDETFPLTSAAD